MQTTLTRDAEYLNCGIYNLNSDGNIESVCNAVENDVEKNYFKERIVILLEKDLAVDEFDRISKLPFNYEGRFADVVFKTIYVDKFMESRRRSNILPVLRLSRDYGIEPIVALLNSGDFENRSLHIEYVIEDKPDFYMAMNSIRHMKCVYFEYDIRIFISIQGDDVSLEDVLGNLNYFEDSLENAEIVEGKYVKEISYVMSLLDIGIAANLEDDICRGVWDNRTRLTEFRRRKRKSFVRDTMNQIEF